MSRVTPSQLAPEQTSPAVAAVHAPCPDAGAPTLGMQLPGASFVLHASHTPLHGALQHTPSVQKPPDGHAAPLVHASPNASRAAHAPALQYDPKAHSSSPLQRVRHPVPGAHAYRPQATVVATLPQWPKPSHVVPIALPLWHVAPDPHDVPCP
jgi:hypothetical protein